MNYVIIGAGPTGVIAAETLRKTDPQGEITLLGDEPEPPYSRMAIPYLLINRIGETGTYLRHHPEHYEKSGIRVVRDHVKTVDVGSQRLTLERGSPLHFAVSGRCDRRRHQHWPYPACRGIARSDPGPGTAERLETEVAPGSQPGDGSVSG